jgi:hypothetical protein
VTSSLSHNNLLYRSSSSDGCGLGLVVVARLFDMVWRERVVSFVRNVRDCNSFNVKGYTIVVFGSKLFVVFSNLMNRCCCGGLL